MFNFPEADEESLQLAKFSDTLIEYQCALRSIGVTHQRLGAARTVCGNMDGNDSVPISSDTPLPPSQNRRSEPG